MLDALYGRVFTWASWPLLALLLVVTLICIQVFDWRKRALKKVCLGLHPDDKRCDGALTLDSRFGYTRSEVRELFDLIGEKGRRLYAITELSLDLAFPFIYGLLLATLLVHLFPDWHWVVLFPLVTATFDLLENVTVAAMALTYAGKVPALAAAASAFTRIKIVFLIGSFLLVAFGALYGLLA